MFVKNGKKKTHPIIAISVGVMALYGAYSMVCCLKDKAQMLTNIFKNKAKCSKNADCKSNNNDMCTEC